MPSAPIGPLLTSYWLSHKAKRTSIHTNFQVCFLNAKENFKLKHVRTKITIPGAHIEDKYKLIYRELQNIMQPGLNNESVFDVDLFHDPEQ